MPGLEQFERMLKDTMGLDVASIGIATLERAVLERQRACQLRDATAYWERARASETERQALIESVVVSETWFFRDRQAFAALASFIQNEWLRGDQMIRLLSLPCSTGEEPYSMAMALLDAGVPANRFRIDAIDISGRVLRHAQHAVYGKSSFRGADFAFRERHFQPVPGGHRLSEQVRRQVAFRHGNVFATAPVEAGCYAAIFCRNMLIYFDRDAQDRAVAALSRMLAPTGLLFVGSSESGVLHNHPFTSAKMPMAFAFKKGRASVEPKRPARVADAPRPAPARRPIVTAQPAASKPAARQSSATSSSTPLDAALALANSGHFAEAAKSCEEHMRIHGPVPEVFYLLGLVRDAVGNHSEAAGYYRKALYLNPRHHDALVHLALLLEKQGESHEAEILLNRARRAAAK